MTNEYEEYLKRRDNKREYYLKQFEDYPKEEVFRKLKIDVRHDYEFINNVVMPKFTYTNPRSRRNEINSISLYFEKIDNDKCVEYLTGKEFIRTINSNDGSVSFYNEDTGLYFNFDSFEPAVGMIIDDVYLNHVVPYFNYYEQLKKEDDRLRRKSVGLMLIKQLKK